jgi:hypothetical protein
VSDGFGRVPLAPEVHAFEAEVGGDEQFVAARRAEDCAVVANAADERGRTTPGGSADTADEFSFGHRHG